MEFALKSHACRAVGGRRKVVSFLVGQVLLRICTEKSLLQGAWRPTESRFCIEFALRSHSCRPLGGERKMRLLSLRSCREGSIFVSSCAA